MLVGIATISAGVLILNLFAAAGLKHLWNTVAILQFVVFMRLWQIGLPVSLENFLIALKSLALFEFIPTDKIEEFFGLKQECNDEFCEGNQTESTFGKLSVFIISGVLLLFLVCVVLILMCCVKCCPGKVKGCYDKMKTKLFYNYFIRYVLLGTLKIQLTLCGTMAIGNFIKPTVEEPAAEK